MREGSFRCFLIDSNLCFWYADGMKNIIQFYVHKGDKYYVAQGVDFPVVTQAESLDELAKNIKEAVECHFGEEKTKEFSTPVMVNFALPTMA